VVFSSLIQILRLRTWLPRFCKASGNFSWRGRDLSFAIHP
jgi:hypothetical protein